MINISFPDGTKKSYQRGITPLEIAQGISAGLSKRILAAKFNEAVVELTRPLEEDGKLLLLDWETAEGKATFWHSTAHLMAEALEARYPGIKFGTGPPIAKGFYYDVDLGGAHLTPENIVALEQKMMSLAREGNCFIRQEISKKEAFAFFEVKKDPYKLALIKELADGNITFYRQGNFTDLCRGPHLVDTRPIKALKITNIAAAYWRGDHTNPQLTRIYGISFPSKALLEAHRRLLEEAKKRDHRHIGKTLGLFTFSQRVGMGLPLWLPKGAILRECLENFLRKTQTAQGYLPVITPHIGQKALYVQSGHYEKYGASSFGTIEGPQGEHFVLKPMNCPHHCEIYAAEPRSYKSLPLRLAEFGTVYRYEQSGELHGLTRARSFTQDDAHIFCTPNQLEEEFTKVIDLVLHIFDVLGFEDYTAQISLRDKGNKQQYIGSDKDWQAAEESIISAAAAKHLNTVHIEGEAAFYGPKLDFMLQDALGRSWQLGTIQVDYQLPQRFGLTYTGKDNKKHTPVIIHRAPFGSMERFIALLIEHYAGNFPLWLAPIQLMVLLISSSIADYGRAVYQRMRTEGFRVEMDEREEKIGKKIREAEVLKVPYMLIIGKKEEKENKIALRQHGKGDVGSLSMEALITLLHKQEQVPFA